MNVAQILVLDGPNMNLLGQRQQHLYGKSSHEDLKLMLHQQAQQYGMCIKYFQSNHEGALIDKTQEALNDSVRFMIINPAGFGYSSIAWKDAVLATNIPFIEVHVSNIHARESCRQKTYFSDIAQGVITGCGINGYSLALAQIHYLIHGN